ncbi:hypothetical protein OSH08_18260 [Kaistia geumhonensis]|uniref:Uncharacterized protein n=1 Tax=Kaistia geumhonensis TaxID=410839 RepID=A0ABU0MAM3_9HYPH|nr:hypothetical protein [Kaistia geumhonensis]MCX5480950.1 hypothetical protein [Kaistia geumhonensis]MDQ0518007.1 hypothetical protein [Kaistia geumhonensis]
MTHLETVLRRAVAELDPSDREGRRRAFGDVRSQMMRLLAVYEPPLSAAEIEGKIDELDTIIRRLEAEYAAPPAPAAVPAPAPDSPAASDFTDEYEAGEEEFVDEEPDEGPFELDDGELDVRDDGVEETPAIAPASAMGRIAAVVLALVIVAAGAAFLVYLAREPSRQQMAEAPPAAAAPAVEAEPRPAEPMASPASDSPAAATPAEPAAESEPPSPGAPGAASAEAPSEPAPTATEPAVGTANPALQPAAPLAAGSPEASGPVAESLILFDGSDPGMFRSTADNPVRFDGYPNGGSVRISSSANSNGARLRVGPGVYQRIAGKHVRILVVARAAPDDPADALRFAYQNGRRLSPWSDQKLTDDFQALVLDWTVPAERTGAEGDSLLIEPGIPGDGTAADIRSVTIDVLP